MQGAIVGEQEEIGVQSRAEIAAMYMDDGKVRHPACFTLEQTYRQFESVLSFLDKHGIQYSAKKSVWPDEVGSYVGVPLDTTQCRAEVQPARAEKNDGAVGELLQQAMAEGVVKRRTLASVVGQLQCVADVAPGMRQLLQPLYAALGSFA